MAKATAAARGITRRHAISALSAATLSLALGRSVHAADAWPTKPVRIIVPFAPGGSLDATARVLAEKLRDVLESIRRTGFAIVDQELEIGLRSIAVPIVDARGRTAAAINISAQALGAFIQHLINFPGGNQLCLFVVRKSLQDAAHRIWVDTVKARQIVFLLLDGAQQLGVFGFQAGDLGSDLIINQLLNFWRNFGTAAPVALAIIFRCVVFQEHISD